MGVRKYTEARAKANKKYDEKTYRKITIYLRVEDDAEILDSLDEARQHGFSFREWLRSLYYCK